MMMKLFKCLFVLNEKKIEIFLNYTHRRYI